MMSFMKSNKFLFFVFLLLGCLGSLFLKREILWDFANYHYYNPWALLNNRLWVDVGLAGYHAFFNPIADIPLYYLIEYLNDYPNLICFIQGWSFGVLLFISYLFLKQYFNLNTLLGKLEALVALLMIMTGLAVSTQVGSASNEIMVSCLTLLGFYFLQKEMFLIEHPRRKMFLLAGFLMGAAMGLKLTSAVYCLSIGIVIIGYACFAKVSFKNVFWFALGGVGAFLLFHGYWMWLLWQKFDNPFFPFANEWFKSEWMPAVNFKDMRFLPQTWYEYVFFPVVWSLSKFHFYDDMIVTDIRLLLWFILALGYGIWLIKNKIRKVKRESTPLHRAWVFSVWFFLVSYVVWLSMFAILRYCIIMEVLGAIFIVQAFVFIKPKTQKYEILYFSMLNILLFALLTTPLFSNDWGKRKNTDESWDISSYGKLQGVYSPLNKFAKYDEKFITMENLNVPDGTVVFFGGLPNAFVLPLLSKMADVKAIGYVDNSYTMMTDDSLNGFFNQGKWLQAKQDIIKKYGEPELFIVSMMNYLDMTKVMPKKYADKVLCVPLKNNVITRVFVCAEPQKLDKYKPLERKRKQK